MIFPSVLTGPGSSARDIAAQTGVEHAAAAPKRRVQHPVGQVRTTTNSWLPLAPGKPGHQKVAVRREPTILAVSAPPPGAGDHFAAAAETRIERAVAFQVARGQ